VDFIATFSENVTGVDAPDFQPAAAGIAEAAILGVTNADPFYIITTSTGVGTGSLRLVLADDDSISDLAGNRLGGNQAGDGNFTAGEEFNISKLPTNFPPPAILGFRRAILTNNPAPVFSWVGVWGAAYYEITVASDGDFSQVIRNEVVEGTSYQSDPPLEDGNYFWRVRAYRADLQAGRFSSAQSIRIDTTPPAAPALLTPRNQSITSVLPSFSWEKISSATIYAIEIDNREDFSSPERSVRRKEPAYKVSWLPKGVYFWRVRSKDQAGNWGSWSETNTFTIR
jgi:hypothetical protein